MSGEFGLKVERMLTFSASQQFKDESMVHVSASPLITCRLWLCSVKRLDSRVHKYLLTVPSELNQ